MTELRTGWLSPDGELYECSSYDHMTEARKIVKKFSYPPTSSQRYSWNADDTLMAKRWVYIGISSLGEREWRIRWSGFLTESQKRFLKPYFEDKYMPVNENSKTRYEEEM